VSRSQPASSRPISAAFRPRGSDDIRHNATTGTAPASGAALTAPAPPIPARNAFDCFE